MHQVAGGLPQPVPGPAHVCLYPADRWHNPWYVAAQLGHEDVEMVFRTYGRFIREDYQKPKPELRIVGSR